MTIPVICVRLLSLQKLCTLFLRKENSGVTHLAKYVLLKNDISILIREDNTIPYLILAVYSPAEREHYGIEMPDQDSKLYRSQDELERLLDASQRICILGAAYHPDVCERFMKRENAYEIR